MTTDHHDRLIQAYTVRWFVLLFGVPLTYAIVRYHVFKGVEWEHFPLYIANKACSLAAVFFIGASYLIGKTIRIYSNESDKRLVLIKFCGLMGFSLAAIHTVMAMLIFSPHYYPTFFHDTGKLNLTGELSMAFGVLGLWCLTITAITSLPFMYEAIGADRWHRGQRMGYLSLILASGHVLVMGFTGWQAPAGWPGSLPPISLVAFIAAIVPVLAKLLWTATPPRANGPDADEEDVADRGQM
jgi:DMSO/TMAO reductase YedYZ heme-binding membrane subunit